MSLSRSPARTGLSQRSNNERDRLNNLEKEGEMKIGFIGLGTMGNAMASSILSSGYPLVVHDLREESAANLIEGGAEWASSPAMVAAEAHTVFTCLPGPPEVKAVLESKDGLIASLRNGAVWLD